MDSINKISYHSLKNEENSSLLLQTIIFDVAVAAEAPIKKYIQAESFAFMNVLNKSVNKKIPHIGLE